MTGKIPRLVVTSAYPASGKTAVSKQMQTLGFERVSSDELRCMLFGKEYPELLKDPEYEYKEWRLLWPIIDCLKADLLREGRDVVVDSTAGFNELRNLLLNTSYGGVTIPAEKYLLILNVNKEELRRRGHPESIELWDRFWEEPIPGDYELLTYRNNTYEDKDIIFSDINRRFERRDKIYVPISDR